MILYHSDTQSANRWSHKKAHIALCLADFVVNTFANNPN
jgi:hypothetical protein